MHSSSGFISNWQLDKAAILLSRGGVIAYPTETVWGLGCRPDDPEAVDRILSIKQRVPEKGLILLASHPDQFRNWVTPLTSDEQKKLMAKQQQPTTWVLPATQHAPNWITGGRSSIAIRMTTHPLARGLCQRMGLLVSTSANRAGKPSLKQRFSCIQQFAGEVDWVMPGQCGGERGASRIIDWQTGRVLR
ncbi:L-threonylcarbamoyladenylate synthase [Pleionea mediterranea]|uniref:Threonylcarbamoyl-AMP synthase n=1 Tax=Pleionea mediterranea TaxID=523701 RepID=A0A316FD58_9GAMM|nr:L-threonylcarbamoyladenylate synthase [Pleionea mediterranea]PWK46814.1 translation factor SUA5 [Pleionea mediterranea]